MKYRLKDRRPDLVFNLVESMEGSSSWCFLPAMLLESMGIPFTGGSRENLYITTDKLLTKRLLSLFGLPTPPFATDPGFSPGFEGPFILKPVREEASVEIDGHSVYEKAGDARSALARKLAGHPGEYFLERFVDGREFNLSVLPGPDGPRVLAPAEIRFDGYDKDMPRVVGYRAKWIPDSFEYINTTRHFDFPPEDAKLLDVLTEMTRQVIHHFAVAGHARVDFRVAPDGTPYILEINCNPCISPDAGFCAAVEQAGINRSELMDCLCRDALVRQRPQGTTPGCSRRTSEGSC